VSPEVVEVVAFREATHRDDSPGWFEQRARERNAANRLVHRGRSAGDVKSIVAVTEHRAAIASHLRDDDGTGDRACAIRVDHLAGEFGAFRDCRERRSDGKCENKRDVRPTFPVRHA